MIVIIINQLKIVMRKVNMKQKQEVEIQGLVLQE